MIRTRFAPSPTGFLHIGGVRTALFNWLFARGQGGRFILRIDDTDVRRNVGEALQPILDGFRWVGIDWDEGPEVGGSYGPYYQSERQGTYRQAASALIAKGLAYWDYARPEELQAEREAAQAAGQPFVYSRRWMAASDADRERFAAQGRQGAVRLKMPRDGACRLRDLIRGDMEFAWIQEQDHVIQRADGTCLYHLASAVDDIEMGITHVIRAEEHLSNTPRQIFITSGLERGLPDYAHLPYVAEPGSKDKLSKRKLARYLKHPDFARLTEHGNAIARAIGLEVTPERFNPVVVDFYREVGYLPAAILNYLLLLGWSLDDRTELFSRAEMIERFTLERVNRASASFDAQKLMTFQERYMNALALPEKVAFVLPWLVRASLIDRGDEERRRPEVTAVVAAAGDRLKVAGDIQQYAEFFLLDEAVPIDPAAFAKRIASPPDAVELLAGFRDRLAEVEPFEPPALEAAMHAFCAERGVALGRIIHAVRVAVTGKAAGFGMFDALAILGRERSLARIERALSRAARC